MFIFSPDVLCAQPNVDAGQIRHNRFRLAMSAGDNCHYGMDRVFPRHFVQTARKAAVGEELATAVLDEIADCAPTAMADAMVRLPSDFPEQISSSIREGVFRRLGRITQWNARKCAGRREA